MTDSDKILPGTDLPAAAILNTSASGAAGGICESAAGGPAGLAPAAVRALAEYADLPLAPGREQAVAAVLGAWLPDVNALSRKMSAPAHQDLVPATIFTHPAADDAEA
jgi:hypothetical protein